MKCNSSPTRFLRGNVSIGLFGNTILPTSECYSALESDDLVGQATAVGLSARRAGKITTFGRS